MTVFTLYENDWGTIELLPSENLSWLRNQHAQDEMKLKDQRFSDGWFAIDAFSGPAFLIKIAERRIQVNDLTDSIENRLTRADTVRADYGGGLAPVVVQSGFAYGTPSGQPGGVYGHRQALTVHELCLSGDSCNPLFAELLFNWGQRFDLLLVDWSLERALRLSDYDILLKSIAGDDNR